MVPLPAAAPPALRLRRLSLATSLVALVRVMLPLLAVVTARESDARVAPAPTCWTRPTASTVTAPLELMLARSAVEPEVMEMVPVPAW